MNFEENSGVKFKREKFDVERQKIYEFLYKDVSSYSYWKFLYGIGSQGESRTMQFCQHIGSCHQKRKLSITN